MPTSASDRPRRGLFGYLFSDDPRRRPRPEPQSSIFVMTTTAVGVIGVAASTTGLVFAAITTSESFGAGPQSPTSSLLPRSAFGRPPSFSTGQFPTWCAASLGRSVSVPTLTSSAGASRRPGDCCWLAADQQSSRRPWASTTRPTSPATSDGIPLSHLVATPPATPETADAFSRPRVNRDRLPVSSGRRRWVRSWPALSVL